MCDTNAYVIKDEGEELFLENVNEVTAEDGSVVLRSLFGEQKVFEGRITHIDLKRHRILLTK